MARQMFKLGARARDTITGFEGTITGRCEYLTGCTQYCLKPTIDEKTGAMRDAEWIDEQTLESVRATRKPASAKASGGPQKDAPRV